MFTWVVGQVQHREPRKEKRVKLIYVQQLVEWNYVGVELNRSLSLLNKLSCMWILGIGQRSILTIYAGKGLIR